MNYKDFKFGKDWDCKWSMEELLRIQESDRIWLWDEPYENENDRVGGPFLLFQTPETLSLDVDNPTRDRNYLVVALGEGGWTYRCDVSLSCSTMRDHVRPIRIDEAVPIMFEAAYKRWRQNNRFPLDFKPYSGSERDINDRTVGINEYPLHNRMKTLNMRLGVLNVPTTTIFGTNTIVSSERNIALLSDLNTAPLFIRVDPTHRLDRVSRQIKVGKVTSPYFDERSGIIYGEVTIDPDVPESKLFDDDFDGNILAIKPRWGLRRDKDTLVISHIEGYTVLTNIDINQHDNRRFPGYASPIKNQ